MEDTQCGDTRGGWHLVGDRAQLYPAGAERTQRGHVAGTPVGWVGCGVGAQRGDTLRGEEGHGGARGRNTRGGRGTQGDTRR